MLLLLLLLIPMGVETVCPGCQQQCSCSSQLPQKPCIGYDPRYLATSVDEALVTFPYLASPQGKPLYDESIEQSAASSSIMSGPAIASTSAKIGGPSTSSSCATQDCMSCKLAIVNGFLDNSPQKENDPLWGTKVRLEQETGLSTGTCDNAQNAPPQPTTRKPRNWEHQQKKRAIPSMPGYQIPPASGTANNSSQSTMDALLGATTQVLPCNYRRGSALLTNTAFSGLCNLCWQWRRLPEDYFPNYVNEVSCDKTDCGCLSGFGTCMPVTRPLNLLKNSGTKLNPDWKQVTIDTVASCECQVSMSSPLLSFIAK